MSLHSMQQDGLRRQLEKELQKNQELQLINRQLREEIQKLKINLQSNEFMLQEMSEEIEKMYNSDRVPLKTAQLVKAYQIKLQEILAQKAAVEAIVATNDSEQLELHNQAVQLSRQQMELAQDKEIFLLIVKEKAEELYNTRRAKLDERENLLGKAESWSLRERSDNLAWQEKEADKYLKAAKKHFAKATAAEKEQKKRIYTAVKTAEKKIKNAYLRKIKIIKAAYTIKQFLPDTLALIFALGWIPAMLYVVFWK